MSPSAREQDLGRLELLLEEYGERLDDGTREAFTDMRAWLRDRLGRELSSKQRAWVARALETFQPTYENAWSAGKVPRGAEVLINCGPLPMRPPGRSL